MWQHLMQGVVKKLFYKITLKLSLGEDASTKLKDEPTLILSIGTLFV